MINVKLFTEIGHYDHTGQNGRQPLARMGLIADMKIFLRLLGMSLLLCSWASIGQEQEAKAQPLPLEDLQAFAEVFGKIKSEYVDGASDEELLRNAIQGMLSGLDPHSSFLGPEAFKEVRISTEGRFGGLGIEVTVDDGLLKIVAPIDGTPAADADIQAGDIVMMIDGVPARGLNLRDAVDSMRGEPGTRIVLTISRDGVAELIEVPLIRAVIKVTSVRGEILEDAFGYVRISNFQSATANNLRNQIKKLHAAIEGDGGLSGLVLDLRNNPGGVLNGAVDVSDLFLEQGGIVSTRGKNNEEQSTFEAKPGDVLNDAPLVVLVNAGSASASEIVAGALQDHKRAIVMGAKTFGKGSVQTVIPMNNGGALKLTTARYFTPLDRSIQAKGIEPDIEVTQTKFVSKTSAQKLVREEDLAGHLEVQSDESVKQDETSPEQPAEDVSRETKASALLETDFQIKAALDMLKGMNLVRGQAANG